MKRSVLVTGGARGIGEAVVSRLVSEGYAVHFTYHQSSEGAERLRSDLLANWPNADINCEHCDLSDQEGVERFCHDIESQGIVFYGFVHNAGVSYDQLGALVELEKAKRLMQINFWSFVQLYKVVVRSMTKQKNGRIVSIGSIAAECGSRGNGIYGASKSALASFNRSIAQEVARKNVTVNTIAPGYIDTDLIAGYGDSDGSLRASIPCRRYGKPEEVASLVSYLLSDNAGYINGCSLTIDGGLSAGFHHSRKMGD